jgi:small subunit ribosomal protein S20
MANHKSSEKSIRKITRRTLVNKMKLSEIRTFIKKVDQAILAKDYKLASESLVVAQSKLMKGVTKGILKLNTASRKVKRLSSKVKSLAS